MNYFLNRVNSHPQNMFTKTLMYIKNFYKRSLEYGYSLSSRYS